MFETAQQFGIAVRRRRQSLGLTQEALALAVNVGRRFIIDLEEGKASCHLGKALAVAKSLGIQLVDRSEEPGTPAGGDGYGDLPDLGDTP